MRDRLNRWDYYEQIQGYKNEGQNDLYSQGSEDEESNLS
jgi:hypothetical protein